jgi:hypothetical protein
MDLREMGYDEVEWIHLGRVGSHWRDLMSMAINFRVPGTSRDLLAS